MFICQLNAEFPENVADKQNCNWSRAARAYSNVDKQHQHYKSDSISTTADPGHLQGKHLEAYYIVCEHFEARTHGCSVKLPLKMVISGTAGTGQSYLIQCLKLLLKDRLFVAAPTGVAAFNDNDYTLSTRS